MAITKDINLKGKDWKILLEKTKVFYPTLNLQPNYKAFIICASLGIMYDKQYDIAGDEITDENETKPSVPRTVLNAHESEIDFLTQTAIMTSKLIDLPSDKRMDLAFNPKTDIEFNKLEFITKFANYGVHIFLDKISDDTIETMETLKNYMSSVAGGYNYEVDGISDDDLNIDDLIN